MMQRPCVACDRAFVIEDEDLAFYEKVSPIFGGKKELIPPPTHCPLCRQQRRLAWRNEHHLYSRDCDLCKKHIISVHRPDAVFPVYCLACWWSDRWNPLEYGMELDTSKPFLTQFEELQQRVPQLAIQNDNGITSENSEYCYDVSRAKNCYRLIGSWYDEDCHYSLNVNHSKSVVDCNTVGLHSELAYECLDSQRLYHCAYLQNCEGCIDCFFGCDLKGCKNCFGCFGLRQQQYCIWNVRYSESEYHTTMQKFDLGSFEEITDMRTSFDNWVLQFPHQFANLQNCEECLGNNLQNCKGVLGYSVFSSEYSKFIDRSDGPKNCYDLINTGGSEWCYDCVTSDDSYMQLFSAWCWKSKYILLSDNCHTSEHLCGCISAKRSKYCILNKQYTEAEYSRHMPQIIASLRSDGNWGEHLPLKLSPFAYNESSAAEYFPKDRESVLARGWKWANTLPYTTNRETITWNHVPDRISDVPITIVEEIFTCTECQKNFKVIQQEVNFYRAMPVPLPRCCPHCRHLRRFKRKTPTDLFNRACDKCKKPIITSYPTERPEIVYCESCYLKTVY